MKNLVWIILASMLVSVGVVSSSRAGKEFRIKNFGELANKAGFSYFYQQEQDGDPDTVRIAVFDNGFDGWEDAAGVTLPESTEYHPGSVVSSDTGSKHGYFMAQIVSNFFTNRNRINKDSLELHLFNVSGFTNFQDAIDEAIDLNVDIILHSLVREYGGNFDGKGFFNSEVSRALEEDIFWVNAAGNFAKTTYNLNRISTNDDDWVKLPGPNNSVPVRCKPQQGKTCDVRFVLSWNDFKDDIYEGTDKDLDLVLSDDTLNIIQGSYLTQTNKDTDEPGLSSYPREIIETEINEGVYFLRVKNRSLNFSDPDRLRITGEGAGLSFDQYDYTETILTPADNPGVLTVGANDSELSSSSYRLHKPDITAPSIVDLGEKQVFAGSSNAAAMVAAALGIIKQKNEDLSREDALYLLTAGAPNLPVGRGLPSAVLGFEPVDGRCYEAIESNGYLPNHIAYILNQGGILVDTTSGVRVMTTFDPIDLTNFQRRYYDDAVIMTQEGFALRNRKSPYPYPPESTEVFQQPSDIPICQAIRGWPRARTGAVGFSFDLN